MPAPLSIDWDHLKTLYLKGLTLPEIAREAAVSYSALRTHAHRYCWKANAAEAGVAVQRAVTLSLAQRGKAWGERLANVLECHLTRIEQLDPAECNLDELEHLVRIIKSLDDVGRRTFGLDEEESSAAGWNRAKCIDV